MKQTASANALPRLQGRTLEIARVAWLLTAVVVCGLFVAGITLAYMLFRTPCVVAPCLLQYARFTLQDLAVLQAHGVTEYFFAVWNVGLDIAFAAISIAVAAVIFWRKSDDRMALFVSYTLLLLGGATFTNSSEVLALTMPAWRVPVTLLSVIGLICFSIFLCVFPNGRFVPHWMRWIAIVFAIINTLSLNTFSLLVPDTPFITTFDSVFLSVIIALFVIVIAAQLYRYGHVSTAAERQQTKWVVFGFVGSVIGYFGVGLIGLALPLVYKDPLVRMIANAVSYGSLILVPLSIGFAVLRARLYDIDIIIRRTLIYGALTAILTGIYLICLFGLQFVLVSFTGQWGEGLLVISTISVLAIAALSRPLRRRIQDFIDQRFYRRQYDAAKVIAAFGASAREEVNADRLTSHLLTVATETLQPEHVSLVMAASTSQTSQQVSVASSIPMDDPLAAHLQVRAMATDLNALQKDLDSPTLRAMRVAGVQIAAPIVSNDTLIGVLMLGARRSQQDYSAEDYELLNALTAQAAPALRVTQLVREKQAEDEQRTRIDQELQLARQIQHSLLPRELPALVGWKLDAFYQSARQVGGDLYDFILLKDGRLGIVIGDVTGKGMPAALLMATTQTTIRTVAQVADAPSEVLARVNAQVCQNIPPQMFITCFYAVLDLASGKLRFANAGHDLPYMWHGESVQELCARGMPLGLLPESVYEDSEIVLRPGEGVLFYTDGIVEAHNHAREMFGFPRLATLLAHRHGHVNVNEFVRTQLSVFAGPDWEQEDDITMVSLQCEDSSQT